MPQHSHDRRNTVHVDGQEWEVIDRIRVKRRLYLIVKKLSSGPRDRYMAVDPDAGLRGEPRVVLVLPHNRATRRHVEILNTLSSKNDHLPTIVDYVRRRGELLVVLNWIHGLDLGKFLKQVRDGKQRHPSPAHAIRLVSRLAHALAQLHRRPGWTHGDIRPANLILTFDPSRLVAIDYGSAWGAPQTVHRPEGDGISRAYSAPELQTAGQGVESSCDQFSVSAVLYELLTLKVPYDGLGGQAGRPNYARQMKDRLVPPSQLSHDRVRLPRAIWKEIDRVVQRGLSLTPDERYPTSGAWVDDLQQLYTMTNLKPRLSPFNARLTRVVSWVAGRLRNDRSS